MSHLPHQQSSRLSIEKYAMALAYVASLRSEDPKRKVGAVALNSENRIIATGYNGLVAKASHDKSWWANDEIRRKYVIHAEANLCSLFVRGDAELVAVTTAPCGPCALHLAAHGVKHVLYAENYPSDPSGLEILTSCGITTTEVQLPKSVFNL